MSLLDIILGIIGIIAIVLIAGVIITSIGPFVLAALGILAVVILFFLVLAAIIWFLGWASMVSFTSILLIA